MTKARDLANILSTAATFDDPTFTGTPSAPTATAGTNTTQIATTAFVQTDLANLVDSAPDALNTLNELAAALGDDANFSTTVTNSIATKAPLASPRFTGDVLVGTTSSTLYYNSTNTYNVSTAIKTDTANEVTELALINGNNDFGSAIDFARTNSATNDVRFATINAMPTSNTAGSESGVMRFYTKGTSDTNVNERFRIGEAGQLGIGGATYGTSGQVLTSGGSGAAPTWGDVASSGPLFDNFLFR